MFGACAEGINSEVRDSHLLYNEAVNQKGAAVRDKSTANAQLRIDLRRAGVETSRLLFLVSLWRELERDGSLCHLPGDIGLYYHGRWCCSVS